MPLYEGVQVTAIPVGLAVEVTGPRNDDLLMVMTHPAMTPVTKVSVRHLSLGNVMSLVLVFQPVSIQSHEIPTVARPEAPRSVYEHDDEPPLPSDCWYTFSVGGMRTDVLVEAPDGVLLPAERFLDVALIVCVVQEMVQMPLLVVNSAEVPVDRLPLTDVDLENVSVAPVAMAGMTASAMTSSGPAINALFMARHRQSAHEPSQQIT
jgi:hypothetical protein